MYNAADVKNMLMSYMDTEKEIDNQNERLELLNQKIYGIGSPSLSDMPRNPSPSNDRFSDMIQKKHEIEEDISRLISGQRTAYGRINMAISKLSSAEKRAVIRMRYLDLNKWEKVSAMIFGEEEEYQDKMDSYLRRVMIIHGQALQEMANILNDNH